MVVELDPRLLEILACPSPDHAPLRPGADGDPEADVLTCTACGRRFPVVDGVPVLLLDEARLPESTDVSAEVSAEVSAKVNAEVNAEGADGSPGEK